MEHRTYFAGESYLNAGRRSGKLYAARQRAQEALDEGLHVHYATADGYWCLGGSEDCGIPRSSLEKLRDAG